MRISTLAASGVLVVHLTGIPAIASLLNDVAIVSASNEDSPLQNQQATATITVLRPSTTVSSIARVGAAAVNPRVSDVSWTVTFADAVDGLTAADFTLVSSGLGGGPAITSMIPSGSAPARVWTVSASSGTDNGTLELDLASDAGLDRAVTNKPFKGQGIAIDRTGVAITSADHATFTVGTANSFSVMMTFSDGTPTLTENGSLAGLTFIDNGSGTATLSGTPATGTGGIYTFTITASNGIAADVVQTLTLTIDESPTLSSANNATFTVGTAGTFTIETGRDFPIATTLSEYGPLDGLMFTDNGNGTATLSGMPAAGTGGTYYFTITASNGVLSNATQTFTLTVNEVPSITSVNNTTFTVGSAGTFTVATGHDFPIATTLIATGPLDGMSFVDNHNGTATLSGTPTAGTGGTYCFTITASNGIAPDAMQVFTLTVVQAPVIKSVATASFIVGNPGSFNVTSTGFESPTLSDDGFILPSGLSFTDNGNGTATLAGTPGSNTAGVYTFTIRAHNGVGSDVQTFTLYIYSAPATVISPTISAGSLTATLGGTVTDTGSGPLIKRGVVYSLTATNANPTIGGLGVTEVDDASASAGTFAEVINGLKPGAAYSFAAFATNGLTSYTSPVPFTTTDTMSTGISGPSDALAGQSIPFTLSASDPISGMQSSNFVFHVKWGDGTAGVVTALSGATTYHTYANPGTYSLQASATDGRGNVLPVGSMTITIHAYVALEGNSLYVTGSSGNDTIGLSSPLAGEIGVSVNGANQGTFAPSNSVVILTSGGADALVGPDTGTPTIWTLSGAKSGTLTNSSLPAPVAFSGITNLTGGAGADTIVVQSAASGFGAANGGGGAEHLGLFAARKCSDCESLVRQPPRGLVPSPTSAWSLAVAETIH